MCDEINCLLSSFTNEIQCFSLKGKVTLLHLYNMQEYVSQSAHQCLAIFFTDFFRSVRHYTYDITKAIVTVPKQSIIYLIIFKGKSSNDMDFTEYNLNLVSWKPISQHASFPTNLDETKQISPDSAHPINSILLNSIEPS